MKDYIPSSTNWGHITKVEVYRKPIMALDHLGREYIENTHGPTMWKLRCDCGHEWEVEAETFPGRRKLKSCGQINCPYTLVQKPFVPKERGSAYSIYLALSVADEVAKYAASHSISFSKACENLLREGLIQKLINE